MPYLLANLPFPDRFQEVRPLWGRALGMSGLFQKERRWFGRPLQGRWTPQPARPRKNPAVPGPRPAFRTFPDVFLQEAFDTGYGFSLICTKSEIALKRVPLMPR